MRGATPATLIDMNATGQAPAARGGLRRTSRRNGRRRHGWIVHAAVLAGCAALFALGLVCAGFLSYAGRVAAMETGNKVAADGIVVLTGGAERVSEAMGLIASGHARRLLISGVHPDTSTKQIGALVDASPDIFECCVDLDRRAANTLGNASETAKWVEANGFRSVIVVTSAYHMPRSLAELGAAMPNVTLEAYPVSPPSLDLARWYLDGGTTLLLLEEYLKYTATRARLALDEAGLASPFLADLAP